VPGNADLAVEGIHRAVLLFVKKIWVKSEFKDSRGKVRGEIKNCGKCPGISLVMENTSLIYLLLLLSVVKAIILCTWGEYS